MNLIDYKLRINELNNCRYVKDLEQLVRKYDAWLPRYSHEFKPDHIFEYKLFVLSLNLFKQKSNRILPDFIYDKHKTCQKVILSSLLEANKPRERKYYVSQHFTKEPTYEELMDWFEFDSHIEMDNSEWYVEKLNNIIDSNPIHFAITFNYFMTPFDRNSTELEQDEQLLVYSIRHKQVNFPNKPQTVWDIFIADNTKNVAISSKEFYDKQILKLEQQISALKAIHE